MDATAAWVLPPHVVRRQVVGRILNMNFVHMRPPLAVHGSAAACLNIVFKHCWIFTEHQVLLCSKHIYIPQI
jgi:hypothetical protein